VLRHGISWAFIMFARVESADSAKGQSVQRLIGNTECVFARARMRNALFILVRSLYCETSVLASSTCPAKIDTLVQAPGVRRPCAPPHG